MTVPNCTLRASLTFIYIREQSENGCNFFLQIWSMKSSTITTVLNIKSFAFLYPYIVHLMNCITNGVSFSPQQYLQRLGFHTC